MSFQPKHALEFSQRAILNPGGFMKIQDIVVEIDAEISRLQQVKALLTGTSTTEMRKPGQLANARFAGKARTRRTLSAEARERIAAAQRARWAKSKKGVKKAARSTAAVSTAKKAPAVGLRAKSKKKRTLSAGARARIAAAQRARWAKVRKAAKKAASAKVAKKSAPAKKAVPAKRAGASKTKAPVAPAAPATPVKAAS
ncbi:MAG: hypothetical protein ABSB50_16935 [Terracidiphilus sp.]